MSPVPASPASELVQEVVPVSRLPWEIGRSTAKGTASGSGSHRVVTRPDGPFDISYVRLTNIEA